MKMNKKMIICGLMTFVIVMAIIPTISANPIPVDTRKIPIEYNIINFDMYADYTFLIYGGILGRGLYEIVNSDGLPFTFFTNKHISFNFSIYAVKTSDFNESEIGYTYEDINNYFTNNSKVIKSNVQLLNWCIISLDNLLDEIQINLNITSLTESSLTFQLSKVIYAYTDGTTTEYANLPVELDGKITITQDSIPAPTINSTMQYWFIGIPIIAATSISLTSAIRYKKRKRQ